MREFQQEHGLASNEIHIRQLTPLKVLRGDAWSQRVLGQNQHGPDHTHMCGRTSVRYLLGNLPCRQFRVGDVVFPVLTHEGAGRSNAC